MKIQATGIPDVLIIEPTVYGDERGFFMESWNKSAFDEAVGRSVKFVQDNHSRSSKGVLRGLHYQVSQPQAKLVRVVRGSVYDVAVDIRKDSPTFGSYIAAELSEFNRRQLWIPEGLAHGFLVLSDFADFIYKTSDYYAPEFERSLNWNDPDLAIDWPVIDGVQPKLSAKDAVSESFEKLRLRLASEA